MRRLTLTFTLALAGAVLTGRGTAQSPTAFGIPSAQQPEPTAGIKAVPGSRAQGWLSQGRSEVLARHGIVAATLSRMRSRRVL